MTWFKVDDGSDFHEKVVAAGNEAWGALCRAGAWSSKRGTDGFVPDNIAALIAPEKVWRKAEAAKGSKSPVGLVERRDDGWQIHDFLQWNPSAAAVAEARAELHEKRSKAGLAGNAKRWEATRKAVAKPSQPDRTCEDQDLAPVPIPSRPVPEEQNRDRVEGKSEGPGDPPTTPVRVSVRDQAKTVLLYWQRILSPKSKTTEPRIAKVSARLAEGYTVEQLCMVVDGAKLTPWNMGQNPAGAMYTGVENIFGNADKVDRHIATAEAALAAMVPEPEPRIEFEDDPDDPDPPGERPEPTTPERLQGIIEAAMGGSDA